jgi:serine/threonine-protein kinase
MATVHLARFHGEAGFLRTVVVKRLHPQFAKDPDFVCMFLDEARLASRVRHPNVVSVHDVVDHRGELLLAMDYVHGVALSTLMGAANGAPVAIPIALALVRDLLAGLHAAHETHDTDGESMQIVHRDVSPQNLMVGEDGVARVVDFGIASATARLQTTGEGQIKGKISYMAPEQIRGQKVDRRVDVFAAGIVLWQLLTGSQFAAGVPEQRIHFILRAKYKKPSELNGGVSPQLDAVVMKALSANPAERFRTAEEFSRALAQSGTPAASFEVAGWVRALVGPFLRDRAQLVREADNASTPPPAHLSRAQLSYTDLADSRKETAPHVSETRRIPGLAGPLVGNDTDTAVTKTAASESARAPRGRRIGVAAGLLALGAAVFGFGGRLWNAQSESPASSPSFASNAIRDNATEAVRIGAAASAPGERGSVANTASQVTSERTPDAPIVASANLPNAPGPARAEPLAKRPQRARPASSPAAAPVAAAPRVQDPCSPPYVLLEGGIRKYKPECL